MQSEEKIVLEIISLSEQLKKEMHSGLGGSHRAQKRARVITNKLTKIMKDYRKVTMELKK